MGEWAIFLLVWLAATLAGTFVGVCIGRLLGWSVARIIYREPPL